MPTDSGRRPPLSAADLPAESRLLEDLGRALAAIEREQSGERLDLGRVDFRRLAGRWLRENMGTVRRVVCTAETRSLLDHPLNELLAYLAGLLQPVFPASIAMPLAYYLCKVGARTLCGDEWR